MIYLEKKQRYMLKGDLHIHTEYSDGDVLDEVLFNAVDSGLDFIAVTDHDTSKGVPFVQEWFKRKGLPVIVIPGCEVTGPGCHLLALGCDEDIICSDSIKNISDEVHQKGGILCAAHPCWSRTIKTFWDNRLFHKSVSKGYFDGIELINYSANYDEDGNVDNGNIPVIEYYRKLQQAGINIPITAGSDAHQAAEIGNVYMIAFPEACTADSVLKAIFKDNMSVVRWKGEVYGPPAAVALYKEYCVLFNEQESFRESIHCSLERQENESDVIFNVSNHIPVTNHYDIKTYIDSELEIVKADKELSEYTVKRNAVNSGRDSMFIGIETGKYSVIKGVITNTESRVLIESKPGIKDGRVIYTVKITNKYSKPLKDTQLHLEINGKANVFIRDIEPGKCVEYDIPAEDILLCGKENKLKIVLLDKSELLIDKQELSVMIHAVNNHDNEYVKLEQYVLKDKKRSDDVEAKTAFCYDDDELTITTVVKDNYFHQPYTGGMIYIGDSIQIGLDPQCGRSIFNMKEVRTFEYQLALTPDGAQVIPNMLPAGVDAKPELDVSVDGNLYTYIFKIKWKDLGIKPGTGTTIGCNIIVNINDGSGRRGWLQWTPGIGDRKRAADWGWLVLN
jgi:PHP-associated/Carbohydrate family 9 binding domain-like/PHP domain